MSSLNLRPSLPIIAVQAGIFYASLFAVKKLMLEPYLKVHGKRKALTAGAADKAKQLTSDNETAIAKIGKSIDATALQAKQVQSDLFKKAQSEKDTLLGAAEKQARDLVQQVAGQMKKELEEQRKDVSRIVAALSDEAFKQVIA